MAENKTLVYYEKRNPKSILRHKTECGTMITPFYYLIYCVYVRYQQAHTIDSQNVQALVLKGQ